MILSPMTSGSKWDIGTFAVSSTKEVQTLHPGPKVIKPFSCSANSTEHEFFPAHKC